MTSTQGSKHRPRHSTVSRTLKGYLNSVISRQYLQAVSSLCGFFSPPLHMLFPFFTFKPSLGLELYFTTEERREEFLTIAFERVKAISFTHTHTTPTFLGNRVLICMENYITFLSIFFLCISWYQNFSTTNNSLEDTLKTTQTQSHTKNMILPMKDIKIYGGEGKWKGICDDPKHFLAIQVYMSHNP